MRSSSPEGLRLGALPRKVRIVEGSLSSVTKKRSNEDACDQFGGETQADGHGGCSGLRGLLLGSGLALLEFAVFPEVGKALIQMSQPCGERGFVGRRLVA